MRPSCQREGREPILEALGDRGVHDLVIPEDFAQALGMYPDAPGGWLITRWRSRDEFRIDPDTAERALAPVIVVGADGRDTVATQAKMLNFRAVLIAGKISFARDIETTELLPRWPGELDDDERARVESFVRAGFGAISSMVLDDEESGRLDWAKRFWRSNWRLYPCRVIDGGKEDGDLDEASIHAAVSEFVDRANDQWERFEVAADPDLYDPDRHEWGHLDRYVLTRCLNPAHRWHRVPQQSTVPAIKPQVMATMLDLTDRVVERFADTIRRPVAQVGNEARESEDPPDTGDVEEAG